MKLVSISAIIILLIFSAEVLNSSTASSAVYAVTQLTNNDYDDRKPQINNNGDVLWVGDGNIFLYNGNTTIQFTNGGSDPQLNDNGWVVWSRTVSLYPEIFLYNGTTTTQLTNNYYFDMDPQINNNGEVVWQGWDGDDGGFEYV